MLDPLARLTRPKVYGVENVPDGGALLVGNHTLYAFLDLPFMLAELWKRRHIWSRGLGEHGHYRVPVWRNLLELCGMVRGTRENLRALMAAHEYVVVFPGGAREVFKHRDERYRLLWRERMGFARLAIEQGYPIVPFAAVGAEEMLEILADDRTPGVAQISDLMKRLVGISLPPIVPESDRRSSLSHSGSTFGSVSRSRRATVPLRAGHQRRSRRDQTRDRGGNRLPARRPRG